MQPKIYDNMCLNMRSSRQDKTTRNHPHLNLSIAPSNPYPLALLHLITTLTAQALYSCRSSPGAGSQLVCVKNEIINDRFLYPKL